MTLEWIITGKDRQFEAAAQRIIDNMASAVTGAIHDSGEQIKILGRRNIATAGFGRRWQNALRVNYYPTEGNSLSAAAYAFHKIPYAMIFQTGGIIAGSPYLWLPLPNVPKTIYGRHMTPANFIRLIGPLHTIARPGKLPLLAAYQQGGGAITIAKLAAAKRGGKKLVSVPLFFGISKVTLRKRFNLYAVFAEAQDKLPDYYYRRMRALA